MKKYKRYQEDLENINKEYLKSTVTEYLYDKDKKAIEDAVKFLVDLNSLDEKEVRDYIDELILTMPDSKSLYNSHKKEIEDFFMTIKDIVGEDYQSLYDMHKNKKIKKNKAIIDAYYNFIKDHNISYGFMADAYKKWYDDISSGKSLITKVNGYKIPQQVAVYCNLTNNVKEIKQWKMKILKANSGGKKGEWDNVGYLAITPDGIMIPIARSDEHQAGFDMLYTWKRKGVIKNVDDFITIFPLGGSYFHLGYELDNENRKHLQTIISSLKLWLKNTKWNTEFTSITGRWKGNFKSFIEDFDGITLEQAFEINDKGFKSNDSTEELLPKGKAIVSSIENLWQLIKRKNKGVFNQTYKLMGSIKSIIDNDTYNEWMNNMVTAEAVEDYASVEDIIFGFYGIKNTMHNLIRTKNTKIKKLFGNLDVAFEEFNRLGNLR